MAGDQVGRAGHGLRDQQVCICSHRIELTVYLLEIRQHHVLHDEFGPPQRVKHLGREFTKVQSEIGQNLVMVGRHRRKLHPMPFDQALEMPRCGHNGHMSLHLEVLGQTNKGKNVASGSKSAQHHPLWCYQIRHG